MSLQSFIFLQHNFMLVPPPPNPLDGWLSQITLDMGFLKDHRIQFSYHLFGRISYPFVPVWSGADKSSMMYGIISIPWGQKGIIAKQDTCTFHA